jgi:hypothetical protein
MSFTSFPKAEGAALIVYHIIAARNKTMKKMIYT